MHIPHNIAKSSLLAGSIFWTILATDNFNWGMIPVVFLSFIPIFICCSLVILVTICPIFWLLESEHYSKQKVFKTCFPIYTIITFSLCCYGIYHAFSEVYMIGFYVSAYITTAQSWVWFGKEKSPITLAITTL
ncbi:MAG: hypothetical protein KBT69_08165 [Oceanihabitans sp.]|nr:hypothetical protein [Oceanihabitans sp.]